LDLGLRPDTFVDEQFRFTNLLLLICGQAVEVLRIGPVHDGELARDEAPDAGDALLAVEYLEFAVRDRVEIDEPQRVSLEQRVNDIRLALSLVDVVPLVLRLNRELPAKAEQ